eukprot:EG_transcript_9557
MRSPEAIEKRLSKKHPPCANLRAHLDGLMVNKRQGLLAEFSALAGLEAALDHDPDLWLTAKLPQNRTRNRYVDILANEPTRVRLQPPAGDSDYINANHVDGAPWGLPHGYLVAQAPSATTVGHWWAMVTQAKVSTIVMLSNVVEQGRIKGHAYWPREAGAAAAARFGAFSVTLEEEAAVPGCPDLIQRTVAVRRAAGEEAAAHRVVLYQFTGWPDHGIPKFTYQLIHLLRLLDTHLPAPGPVLIHCSAGVGRSGVLLTAHIIWSQLRQHLLAHPSNDPEFSFDVVNTVARLRRCRNHIVQTPEQLAFTYVLLLHASERLLAGQGSPRAANAAPAPPSSTPSPAADSDKEISSPTIPSPPSSGSPTAMPEGPAEDGLPSGGRPRQSPCAGGPPSPPPRRQPLTRAPLKVEGI